MRQTTAFIFLFCLLSYLPLAQANQFDNLKDLKDWQGTWILASDLACSNYPVMSPNVFNFVEAYTWEFTEDGTLVENMRVEDCKATHTYSVELLPVPDYGLLRAFRQIRLTRTSFASKCLRDDVRPKVMTLSFIAHPNFIETYQEIRGFGACPHGEYIVMQLKRIMD